MGCVERVLALALAAATSLGCGNVLGIDAKECAVDTRSDPLHCGACNRSCLGGQCADGRCEQVLLAPAASSEGTGPGPLVIGDTHVYWSETTSGQIRRIAKTGGLTESLITTEPGSHPTQLALAGDLYFVVYGAIAPAKSWVGRRAAVDGKVFELVGGMLDGAWTLDVDGEDVVWGNRLGPNAVMKTSITGAAPEVVLPAVSPDCCELNEVAIDGDWIYVAQALANRVVRVSRSSGEQQLVAEMVYATGLSVDDEAVYFSGDQALWRYSKQSGALMQLANVPGSHSAPDATHLYFTSVNAGVVGRVPKHGGGDVEILVEGLNGVYAIAVDEQMVYFATQFVSHDQRHPRGVYALAK